MKMIAQNAEKVQMADKISPLQEGIRYNTPFKPFSAYPYRRAVLSIHACGERCPPVQRFSHKVNGNGDSGYPPLR